MIALVDSKHLKAQDSSLGSQNSAKKCDEDPARPKTQLRSDRVGMHLHPYPAAGSPILHELPMDHFALENRTPSDTKTLKQKAHEPKSS